ncbi:MAG: phosphoribosyltransferase family protein [bacterium]
MNSRLTLGGNISGLVSACHFEKEGTLQALIHQLKYSEMTGIGIELGKKLGENLRPFLGDVLLTAIIPVALHPAKKRERGYNQAEFIAQGMHKVTRIPVLPSLLKRNKNTRTQTKLNLEERQANVSEAFGIPRRHLSLIKGSSFVLVDDVITTGATIQECAQVLKSHGAKDVYAASVALADHAIVGLI